MSESDDALSEAETAALAKAARLPLDAERLKEVAPTISGMLAQFDVMDAVELGETPPTNAFDARWRSVK